MLFCVAYSDGEDESDRIRKYIATLRIYVACLLQQVYYDFLCPVYTKGATIIRPLASQEDCSLAENSNTTTI